MSAPFPDWASDATAPTLAERRGLLLPGLARHALDLRDASQARQGELLSLREDLEVLDEGAVWRQRAEVSVARQERDRHLHRARRGRHGALALAAGVLALSIAGPFSKRSEALVPGARTALNLRTLRTTGEGVVVAGRGEVTLEDAAEGAAALTLHEGRIEVAAAGDEPVTVTVGPHRVSLEGGRLHVTRRAGTVMVVVDEGAAQVEGPLGQARLVPGAPPWTPPPPEEVETCGGEDEAAAAEAGAPPADAEVDASVARSRARTRGRRSSSAAAASLPAPISLRIGPDLVELGIGGRRPAPSLDGPAPPAPTGPAVDPPTPAGRRILPVVGGGGATRASGAPRGGAPVRSGGGVQVARGAPPLAGSPGGTPTLAALAPGGAGPARHAVTHTVETGLLGGPSAMTSRLGVCMMPESSAPPVVSVAAPSGEESGAAAVPAARPAPVAPRPASAPSPSPVTGPTRSIPVAPGGAPAGGPSPPGPAAIGASAPSAPSPSPGGALPMDAGDGSGPDPLSAVVFGLPVEPPECAP